MLTDIEQGIQGLKVKAWDIDIGDNDPLDDAITDASGYFETNF